MNKPIIIIIFLILIVMVAFLFVIPKYQQYHDLQDEIAKKQAQYSGESIYFARISDILTGLESRASVLDKIQSALPADVSLASLVDFLQKKANENGVLITSTVFSQLPSLALDQTTKTNALSGAKDILFTVSVTGGYDGLKSFLLAMDNSARLFEVDTLSFSKVESLSGVKTAKTQPQQYNLKLEVRTRAY